MALLVDPGAPGEIVISPWIKDLIRRYEDGPRRHRQRRRRMIIIAGYLIAAAAIFPWFLRFYHSAYPREPESAQALELCSRSDPTFIRFLASDRTTCFGRLRGVIAGAALTAVPR